MAPPVQFCFVFKFWFIECFATHKLIRVLRYPETRVKISSTKPNQQICALLWRICKPYIKDIQIWPTRMFSVYKCIQVRVLGSSQKIFSGFYTYKCHIQTPVFSKSINKYFPLLLTPGVKKVGTTGYPTNHIQLDKIRLEEEKIIGHIAARAKISCVTLTNWTFGSL